MPPPPPPRAAKRPPCPSNSSHGFCIFALGIMELSISEHFRVLLYALFVRKIVDHRTAKGGDRKGEEALTQQSTQQSRASALLHCALSCLGTIQGRPQCQAAYVPPAWTGQHLCPSSTGVGAVKHRIFIIAWARGGGGGGGGEATAATRTLQREKKSELGNCLESFPESGLWNLNTGNWEPHPGGH